jgi:hypothetical protein
MPRMTAHKAKQIEGRGETFKMSGRGGVPTESRAMGILRGWYDGLLPTWAAAEQLGVSENQFRAIARRCCL